MGCEKLHRFVSKNPVIIMIIIMYLKNSQNKWIWNLNTKN